MTDQRRSSAASLSRPYLPKPVVEKQGYEFSLNYDMPKSIGKVRAFTGSFAILVRAYAYILANGADGLREVSEGAVANANYVLARVRQAYDIASGLSPMHEFVITGERQKHSCGCTTLDIAKRLIDYGFHPPTVYFPLIVPEAMMVEPTETESRQDLDALADAFHNCRGSQDQSRAAQNSSALYADCQTGRNSGSQKTESQS